MVEGRDEVGAARDWLRGHGVVVPDGAGYPVDERVSAVGSGTGAAAPAWDRHPVSAGAPEGRADGPTDDGTAVEPVELVEVESRVGQGRSGGARTGRSSVRAVGHGGGDDLDGAGLEGDDGPGARRSRGRRSARGGGGAGAARAEGVGASDVGSDADPEEVARTIVLRKLSAQARTRAELERALRTKAVPEEAASTVLDRMGEVGLVDDAAFARDWVASRQQRRHLSRTALRRELQTKGVDREVIDEALADVGGADEHRAALDLARRKAGAMKTLPREVAYRRLGGVLARRGFSASVTTSVLADVLGSTDDD